MNFVSLVICGDVSAREVGVLVILYHAVSSLLIHFTESMNIADGSICLADNKSPEILRFQDFYVISKHYRCHGSLIRGFQNEVSQ